MSHVYKTTNGYYYLRNNNDEIIESFGETPPIKYFPHIIEGDARKKIYEIPKETISLIITSPPYYNIKDYQTYGEKQQIGYLQGYNEYINSLKEVWRGCYHTLHKGCRLCINIGDQFTRTEDYGKHIAFPNHADIIKSCIDLNLDYLGSIIWQKLATCNTSGGASVLGSYPYPPNGLVSYNYEHILIFKKPGERPKVDEKIKKSSKISKNDWFIFFNSPWKFAGKKQNGHIAQFPKELPQRLIRMFSFIGDIILDPFVGSGTTCIASIENRRKSIGIELNSKYIKLIEKNIQKTISTAGKHWRWEQLA